MSAPATVGGLFEAEEENPYREASIREQYCFNAGVDATMTRLGRVVYGVVEPCPECKPLMAGPCSRCHGTGRIKTPGLVERVVADVSEHEPADGRLTDYLVRVLVREAIAREIGGRKI